MGENKHIEELDAFAKKFVKEIPQEKPSESFTSSLMQVIAEESTPKVFKTSALISRKVWVLIFLLITTVLFIPFKESEKSVFNLPKVDFSFFDKIQIPNLFESISLSSTVLYAVFFFGLMIIAQVFFLKNHFNKRFR